MAKHIGKRTITVIRKAKVDRLSTTPAPDAVEHDIPGCAILPKATLEEGKGWVVTDDMQVFAPYGADIQADDLVLIPGDPKAWNVEGTPADYENKHAIGKATLVTLTRTGAR